MPRAKGLRCASCLSHACPTKACSSTDIHHRSMLILLDFWGQEINLTGCVARELGPLMIWDINNLYMDVSCLLRCGLTLQQANSTFIGRGVDVELAFLVNGVHSTPAIVAALVLLVY
eukprot:6303502-Amphidinium_carterae.2